MDNYSGLNVSAGLGDGAAQVPKWNRTNHAIDLLYQQQQQRVQAGYNDYLQTQSQLNKELANVRSADIPELRQLYDTQKALHQQLLFNPKLQRDRRAYSEAEKQYQDANMRLMQGIHGSIETQNFDKAFNEDLLNHDYNYGDDARKMHDEALQLPTSQRLKKGYNSLDVYMQNAPGNFDWQKAISDAKGTATKAIVGKEMKSPDGFSYLTPTYNAYTNPAQFQQSLMGELAQKQAGKAAAHQYSLLAPEQVDAVNKAYDAIPQGEFDKWQTKKPNLDVPENAPPEVKYAAYLSKQYALNNLPTVGETKVREDYGARLSAQLANQKTMEAIRHGDAVSLAALRHKWAKADKASQDNFVDGYIENLKQDAIKNGKREYQHANADGTTTTEEQYTLRLSPETKKLFTTPSGVPVDEVRVLKNGDILPVYLKYTLGKDNKTWTLQKAKNGKAEVDVNLTQPINKDELKLIIAKQFSTPQVNKAMNDDGNDDEPDDDQDEIIAPTRTNKRPPLNSFVKP